MPIPESDNFKGQPAQAFHLVARYSEGDCTVFGKLGRIAQQID